MFLECIRFLSHLSHFLEEDRLSFCVNLEEVNFQGRNFCNFWLGFWEKRWPHKFILNLTDLYLHFGNGVRNSRRNRAWGLHIPWGMLLQKKTWLLSYYFGMNFLWLYCWFIKIRMLLQKVFRPIVATMQHSTTYVVLYISVQLHSTIKLLYTPLWSFME